MISENHYRLDLGGGTLTQFANRSITQMMSYIIDCPDGDVIVIDGGMYCAEDAANLHSELKKRGSHVSLWIFSHCHIDHYGAFLYLCEQPDFDIRVDRLCYHFPDYDWLMTKEDVRFTKKLFPVIENSGFEIMTPRANDVISCGGIRIEILSEPICYENYPTVNPTSMIFKVHFPRQSVLFLGDFDVHGEANYEKYFSKEKLRCDIVQMAHHGQDAVSRSFYQQVHPKYCLYTAPDWLWENNKYGCNDPETRGRGRFTTLETRLWMAELKVIRSFHLGEGDWIFT